MIKTQYLSSFQIIGVTYILQSQTIPAPEVESRKQLWHKSLLGIVSANRLLEVVTSVWQISAALVRTLGCESCQILSDRSAQVSKIFVCTSEELSEVYTSVEISSSSSHWNQRWLEVSYHEIVSVIQQKLLHKQHICTERKTDSEAGWGNKKGKVCQYVKLS